MDDIQQLKYLFKLKEVDRRCRVLERHESTAEHIYSSQILTQYFLPKISQELDELKIMKLTLYHDLVEIEAGDTFVLDEEGRKTKKEREKQAMAHIKATVPKELAAEIETYWQEYEVNESMEAKFCHAVDAIDPAIQCLYHKEHWQQEGFTEEWLEARKARFVEFPVLLAFFEEIVSQLKEKGHV
ncbi:MAG: HD domain-containing protein [Candidatus Woesearchaeota archaeon]|nr:HD domain-containing protein [Candidatus Woesearchaeota archaeon]